MITFIFFETLSYKDFSKLITKSLPQQSFFYIISIEKHRKRFAMKLKMKMNIEMNSIVDFWYCSIFERSFHKTEIFVIHVKKTQTWIHEKYIQYYSILFPSKYSLFHRVPWRWRYCKSKQCSNDNDNFPTFAKPSEVKANTNEQFHSLS